MSQPYRVSETNARRVRELLGDPLFAVVASAFASYSDVENRRESSVALTALVLSTSETWIERGGTDMTFRATLSERLGELDEAPPIGGWVVAVTEALTAISGDANVSGQPAPAPSSVRRRTREEMMARNAERFARSMEYTKTHPQSPQPPASLSDFTWVGSPIMRAWYLDPSKTDAWRGRVLDTIRPLLRSGWSLDGVRAALDAIEVEEPPLDLTAPRGWLSEVAIPRLLSLEPNTLPHGFLPQ